jgi:predicted phage terminase large subunit-like protein
MVSYFVSEFCLQGHFVKFDYYELLASTCRDSYFEFVKQFWHTIVKDPLVCNWHIKYLCDTIQESMERVFRGENSPNDLLVNISPGTSKSTLFSVMLVPWAWTRMPHLRMIGASYTDALALDLSGKSRQIVESALYQKTFPNIRLSKDTNSKSHWANTYNGDRYAVAVGGSVTGMHAHIIVIDDPINPREVRSKADLETAKNWCKETISSRKVNKDLTPTFVVMQRLHQDDPSTLYIERGESAVRHICLPGEITPAVKPESLRAYYQNNLFDPVRLSRPTLDRMQIELGQFGYSGQILQDPIPLGGGMFKSERINIVEYPPGVDAFQKIVRYWDKAATNGGGDWSVGVKMGLHKDGSYWILDICRGQWSSDERERQIVACANRDGKSVRIGIEREPGSSGVDSVKDSVKRLSGFRVYPNLASGKKELRADTFSVQVNAGNVYMVKGAYNTPYLEELAYFPNGKHDDQVDASSGAFSMLDKQRTRLGIL